MAMAQHDTKLLDTPKEAHSLQNCCPKACFNPQIYCIFPPKKIFSPKILDFLVPKVIPQCLNTPVPLVAWQVWKSAPTSAIPRCASLHSRYAESMFFWCSVSKSKIVSPWNDHCLGWREHLQVLCLVMIVGFEWIWWVKTIAYIFSLTSVHSCLFPLMSKWMV